MKTVSVKDFGAVGDGRKNDSAAFQAACDSGAEHVVIPRGVYKLRQTVSVASGVSIAAEDGAEMLCNPEEFALANDDACRDVSVDGGVWKNGAFAFRRLRGLNIRNAEAEFILLLGVDGFEVADVRADWMGVSGCTHCGKITGCVFKEHLSLRDCTEDKKDAGPVDEVTIAGIETPRVTIESKRSTLRAISIDAPGAELELGDGTDAYCDEVVFNGRVLDGQHKSRGEPVRFKTRVFADPGLFEVTSPFGPRVHPVTGEVNSVHNGIDGALWNGRMLVETMILACDDGVVTAAEETNGPAGTYVAIAHRDGVVSKYFHLERGSLRVEKGESVKAGAPLGRMGRTGRSTGEHLHFQIEKDGVPVDPTPWLVERH